MDSLKRLLKQKRKEMGLGQDELAKKAGVGLRLIRDIEQGKKTLQLKKVNQVLSLFGYEMAPAKIQQTTEGSDE